MHESQRDAVIEGNHRPMRRIKLLQKIFSQFASEDGILPIFRPIQKRQLSRKIPSQFPTCLPQPGFPLTAVGRSRIDAGNHRVPVS